MEKVKPYLDLMVKHHFWVLSAVVLIVCLLSWFIATGNVQAEFTQKKADIDGKFGAMTQVKGKENHPNEVVIKGIQDCEKIQSQNVYEAWDLRYQEQLKVPQWPNTVYPQEFCDYVNSLPADAEIDKNWRELYGNYIKGQFPILHAIINLRDLKQILDKDGKPIVPLGAVAGAGQDISAGMEWQGLVAWSAADRAAFESKYLWSTRTPTTLQVRFANEDLYVANALFKIIAKCNEIAEDQPIKEHMQANIKRLSFFALGQDVPAAEEIFQLTTAGPGGEGQVPTTEDGGAGLQAGNTGVGGVETGQPVNPDEAINNVIKHRRYVDSKGVALSFDKPDAYAEFRIMPFQMNLFMDQRKIHQLLANCANSPLPVEVRQVSVVTGATGSAATTNTTAGGPGGGGGARYGGEDGGSRQGSYGPGFGGPGGGKGGMGAFQEGGPGGGISRPGFGGPGGSGLLGGGGGVNLNDPNRPQVNAEVEPRKFDLEVQVRGVVYIFNKPDKSKFLKGSGDAPLPEAGAPVAPAEGANPNAGAQANQPAGVQQPPATGQQAPGQNPQSP